MSNHSWAFSPEETSFRLVEELRQKAAGEHFDLAVVLGSGWGKASSLGKELAAINYCDWPCFPAGQITGHNGKLSAVRYASRNILVFSGRFHCYQGLSAFEASFPVRLASALGCSQIVLTCATGGINRQSKPGDFMLIDDHINLLGDNPLRGLSGETFVDLTKAYRQDINDHMCGLSLEGVTLHRGVLAAMSGPSYETPAEITFLERAGADVVSMSVVHETIMARYLNMQVAAVSFIANYAAGRGAADVSHEDVLSCSAKHAHSFPLVVTGLIDACLEGSSFS